MMSWNVHPYIGVNELNFGMSAEKLLEKIGGSPRIKLTPSGGKRYFFGIENPIFKFSPSNELEEISFSDSLNGNIFLGDFELNWHKEAYTLQQVCKISGNSNIFEVMGFVVFLNLGMALSGFNDNVESQKAVVCFKKNLWNSFIPEMKSIEF